MHIQQETIDKIQQSLNQKKILVVGDVMLDRYWFGEVNRISPEAPVPIARINETEDRPGGAANVARNIASLGGNVTLLSVVGDDEAATNLEKILVEDNVKFKLQRDKSIDTIVKLRVIARNQQLIRLDFEKIPSHEILLKILDSYEKIIEEFEVIILSDYGKGGLAHTSKMIEIAKKHNKQVLVDPKGSDYTKYIGATMITPNKTELKDATGNWNNEQELINNAIKLKNDLKLEYLLVTRSEEGMTLFTKNDTINYDTVAQEVFDVSGAGDTVIATLALMLANDIDISQAVQVANIAAGIVVGKLGTAAVSKEELLRHLE
ncbi:MAG: D-glycero-beta-D-manno-heptose-7-phosphate kinase [Proteobacteria bacterium]|jgi:rfaE bifunctional protein kinase chain/domain|nr:D-glycero-beta-D-manno-heptose-7-phosphate kinase [Pseudomonadota bacterium]